MAMFITRGGGGWGARVLVLSTIMALFIYSEASALGPQWHVFPRFTRRRKSHIWRGWLQVKAPGLEPKGPATQPAPTFHLPPQCSQDLSTRAQETLLKTE